MIYLKALGYSSVKSLSGGTSAWIEEGFRPTLSANIHPSRR